MTAANNSVRNELSRQTIDRNEFWKRLFMAFIVDDKFHAKNDWQSRHVFQQCVQHIDAAIESERILIHAFQ